MATLTILSETTLDSFEFNELFGCNIDEVYPAFTLIPGETYKVTWNGTEHTVVAQDASVISTEGTVVLGNASMYSDFGLTGNNEPFLIASPFDAHAIFAPITPTPESEYTVSIVQEKEDVGIVLKDINGEEQEYKGVTHFQVPKADGTMQTFVPNNIASKTIELDFTDGHMTVPADEGTVMNEVIINRPENLIPANIADGVTIAGIEGKASILSEGSAIVYSTVLINRDITPANYNNETLLIDADTLKANGIDLSNVLWYKNGHPYIVYITLNLIHSFGNLAITDNRCIKNAWISNVAVGSSSTASQWIIGYYDYVDTNGYTSSSNSSVIIYSKDATYPLAKYSHYTAYVNRLLFVRDGSVYITLYNTSSVAYGLYGDYAVTVTLIPV